MRLGDGFRDGLYAHSVWGCISGSLSVEAFWPLPGSEGEGWTHFREEAQLPAPTRARGWHSPASTQAPSGAVRGRVGPQACASS